MTVGKLIETLKQYPTDTAIEFCYTYPTDFGDADAEYGYDPTFKFYDTIKILDINLF